MPTIPVSFFLGTHFPQHYHHRHTATKRSITYTYVRTAHCSRQYAHAVGSMDPTFAIDPSMSAEVGGPYDHSTTTPSDSWSSFTNEYEGCI